jgi:hypothetical protein
MSQQHHTVLIVGGGAAVGVSVVNNMRKTDTEHYRNAKRHCVVIGITLFYFVLMKASILPILIILKVLWHPSAYSD